MLWSPPRKPGRKAIICPLRRKGLSLRMKLQTTRKTPAPRLRLKPPVKMRVLRMANGKARGSGKDAAGEEEGATGSPIEEKPEGTREERPVEKREKANTGLANMDRSAEAKVSLSTVPGRTEQSMKPARLNLRRHHGRLRL